MNTNTGTQYSVVFPLAKRSNYESNETIDFVISLENRKLVPNSLTLCGDAAVYTTKVSGSPETSTAPTPAEELLIDPDTGYHSLFRDIVSEFRQVGVAESFSYYPRYVKMKHQAMVDRDSLGTETNNAIEGCCPNQVVRRGYNYGINSDTVTTGSFPQGAFVPFALKPQIAPNKCDQGIPGNQLGVLRLRIRLSPDEEVLFGQDAGSASGYFIKNLQIRFETEPDDGTRPPLNMEVYNINRQVIETNQANLSTFVPGKCSAVHMSFNSTVNESTLGENFLKCTTIPGTPLTTDGGEATTVDGANGADRLYYAINDSQTALVGFTMQTREEMVYNYLRSWNLEPKNYGIVQRRLNNKEGYGLGIPFGTLLDFSQQQFSVDIDSDIGGAVDAGPFAVYLYFKGLVTL